MRAFFKVETWFAPCEPNLASLPTIANVGARTNHSSGVLWTSGLLFVVGPLFVLAFLISGMRSEKFALATFLEALMFWGTGGFLLVVLIAGISEFWTAWQVRRYRRSITFGQTSVSVKDNLGGKTDIWEVPYSSYQGIVLHVTNGELPQHNMQYITLRNSHKARNIALHASQGSGLDPSLRRRARLWADQLNVPALIEVSAGQLVALD